MTEKDLEEFEKEFGFKLLPTSFKKPISYHTTLESALQSYSNNRMADLVSNIDLDLKQVKQAINDLKRELKTYE